VNEPNLVSDFEVEVEVGGEASITPGSINKKMAPRINSYLCSSRFWEMTTEIRTSQQDVDDKMASRDVFTKWIV
jgi:hypothetical protein